MTDSTTFYTVSQYINGHHAFSTDPFASKEEAEAFLEDYYTYTHDHVDYAIFKCKTKDFIRSAEAGCEGDDCCEEEYYEDEEEHDLSDTLASMTVEDYGKGFLLRANEDDERFGEKYLEVEDFSNPDEFVTGFWITRAQGWFFKKHFLDVLLENGAEYISDEVNDGYEEAEVCDGDGDFEEEEEFDDEEEEEISLEGMKYRKFGKGYLLKCKKSNPLYGEAYLLDGWWNAKENGWFFKKEFLQELKDFGAKKKKSSSSSKSEKTPKTFAKMNHGTWETYGKGFLFVPNDTEHESYGEKYYHGGWWMPTQSAWFFRKSVKESL